MQMENRYYVKLYWSYKNKLWRKEKNFMPPTSFMVEADSKDQIKEMIDPKHEILEITRV